ncbi:ribosomal protection-like ABC-F family protein [Phocicoccus pinnipedialis]|uniref:Putative ABC transporter ATP-binding protein YheS n=1 Tax=Phocicoccus pinnipedialis TaxID=110845 RepID=A0A6V7RP04_9BACL|nr:ATP-binding cassette domain-containing protein [Jeotgalicoccus pinnipedialis]MBP1939864.1 macrolide transport system ATP-binding/permease protein [Jeotgalicoccus pinnipedialis]CAD2079819.1 putative ABC transporter ATP-binding protein YheS [Jeotgalicoccus pinnipedialis]
MIMIELKNISVDIEGNKLFTIDRLIVNEGERVFIIGDNGVGKSTLLNLITGIIPTPKGGVLSNNFDFSYLKQNNYTEALDYNSDIDYRLLNELNVPKNKEGLSGGELKKLNITDSFSLYKECLILDEPTTHLDKTSIDILIEELKYYYGTILCVSHSRDFINALATKIWEIEDGVIKEYIGNYNDYLEQKEVEKTSLENEQNAHNIKREALLKSIEQQRKYAESLKQKKGKDTHNPGRLAQSKPKDVIAKNAFRKLKNLEGKLEKMGDIEKIEEKQEIKFPTTELTEIHNKIPIYSQSYTLIKGNKVLLEDTTFQFPYGKKIGIVGDNGTGKSSFLADIVSQNEQIEISSKLVINVYNQMDYEIKSDKNIFEYLQECSSYNDDFIKQILFNLRFSQDDFRKKISDLSGGESTRLKIAFTFLKTSNTIILDEPTNFLDLSVIKSLEELMKSYKGMIIYTSHDESFIKNTANLVFKIEDKKLVEVV